MAKVAVILLSGLDTQEGRARTMIGLSAAKEFKDAGDHVDLVFDGSATRTLVEVSRPGHQMYHAFKAVEEVVAGMCRFCATHHHVDDVAERAGFTLLGGQGGHPSVRNFLVNGYQVVTF